MSCSGGHLSPVVVMETPARMWTISGTSRPAPNTPSHHSLPSLRDTKSVRGGGEKELTPCPQKVKELARVLGAVAVVYKTSDDVEELDDQFLIKKI